MENQLLNHAEKLTYVRALAEKGSFSAAASALRISQPALSRAISILEDAIELKIFDRGRLGSKPTKLGKFVIQFAFDIEEKSLETLRKIHPSDNISEYRIKLGTKEPFAIHIWPYFLRWLQKNHKSIYQVAKNVDLKIDKSTTRLVKAFQADKLDMLLVADTKGVPQSRDFFLFNSHFNFFMGTQLASITPTTYTYLDAVVKADKTLSDYIGKTFNNVQSFDAAREMAAQGLGIALLPHWIAKIDLNASRLVVHDKSSPLPKIPTSKIVLKLQRKPILKRYIPLCEIMQKFCDAYFSG